MKRGWLALALAMAGCDAIPRDPKGTSERIAATRILRVGLDGPVGANGERLVKELATVTGAEPALQTGALEAMIHDLDRGALDLIVAPVRADALLASEVALGPPLDGSDAGDRPVAVRALVRNGENRWLMTVERASRRVAGQ